MGVISEILFCEPTATGQMGAAMLHLLVWAFITNYQHGVMACVNAWVKRQPWYSTVQENFKDDEVQKVYDFPDPGFNYITFIATIIHHGCAGLLMSLGMFFNQPWLWRHGMMCEVAGMDVLDAIKIAHVKYFPPGTHPTSLFMKSNLFAPLMFFHHSVGICVGIPVNLYFSEIHAFQMFGLMTLGFPAVCLTPSLVVKTLDAKQYANAIFANRVYLLLTFGLGSRAIYHFPAAWYCFLHVAYSPIGSWSVLLPFTWALLAMSAFNLMILGIQLQGVYDDGRHLLGWSAAPAKSSPSSMFDFVAHVSAKRRLTHVYVACKTVTWARRASLTVKKRNSVVAVPCQEAE